MFLESGRSCVMLRGLTCFYYKFEVLTSFMNICVKCLVLYVSSHLYFREFVLMMHNENLC